MDAASNRELCSSNLGIYYQVPLAKFSLLMLAGDSRSPSRELGECIQGQNTAGGCMKSGSREEMACNTLFREERSVQNNPRPAARAPATRRHLSAT